MGSVSTSLGNFGRAWSFTITPTGGDPLTISNLGNTPSLRATFDITMVALQAYWLADLDIFNMSSQTAGSIQGAWKFGQPLSMGDSVSISAGYQQTQSGPFFLPNGDVNPKNLLYTGNVLQSVWTRENVVDYRLRLRCVIGLMQDSLNFVSLSFPKGVTPLDTLNQVCKKCGITLDPQNIDAASKTALTQTRSSRAQTFHSPYDAIREVLNAKRNNLLSWVGLNGLNVRSFNSDQPLQTPAYAYGPPNLSGSYAPNGTTTGTIKPTLIGTPEQTQDGVTFKVLLDSQVKIGDIVQLAPGTLINLAPVQVGSLPPVPSQNGTYVVAGVRHVGDTRGRGEDWYTEITGMVMGYFANFLAASNPLITSTMAGGNL